MEETRGVHDFLITVKHMPGTHVRIEFYIFYMTRFCQHGLVREKDLEQKIQTWGCQKMRILLDYRNCVPPCVGFSRMPPNTKPAIWPKKLILRGPIIARPLMGGSF